MYIFDQVFYLPKKELIASFFLQTPNGQEYVIIRPKHSLLYFPALEWVRSGISKAVTDYGNLPIVLDCRHLNGNLN